MAITKCGNGHIYDSDIYAACPYCNNRTNGISFNTGATESINTDGSDIKMGGTVLQSGNATVGLGINDISITGLDPTVPGDDILPDDRKGRHGIQMGKTVIADMNTEGIVPVVGWIVCIEGKMRGKSYKLCSKQNSIGRSVKSDAYIEGDSTISNHQANISYDKRHNTFTLVPKTETNTMYLNDEAVYESVRLKAYDLIEMGNSKFLFVPFCGERFKWE